MSSTLDRSFVALHSCTAAQLHSNQGFFSALPAVSQPLQFWCVNVSLSGHEENQAINSSRESVMCIARSCITNGALHLIVGFVLTSFLRCLDAGRVEDVGDRIWYVSSHTTCPMKETVSTRDRQAYVRKHRVGKLFAAEAPSLFLVLLSFFLLTINQTYDRSAWQ
jgi:hypothetical protein